MASNKLQHPYNDPLNVSSLNVDGKLSVGSGLAVGGALTTGGSSGSAGQVLTSSGSSLVWSSAGTTLGSTYVPLSGTATTIANITTSNLGVTGTIIVGEYGDGGIPTSANVNTPYGIFVDSSNNIYITESSYNRVRKITASTGIISTICGNGTATSTGDGGLATSATLNSPNGVFVDSSNNIYITESGGNRIRKITAATGIISTICGNGTATSTGDGGFATYATLNLPYGIFVDSSNNIYITELGGNKVRKITASTGVISTVCGTGSAISTGDGGLATSANTNGPTGVYKDSSKNIYVTEYYGLRIRKFTEGGNISTICGTGLANSNGDGSTATGAGLNYPWATWLDSSNNIYITESVGNRIRKITVGSGIISTFCGNGTASSTGDGGLATSATTNVPTGVFIDSSNNMYLVESGSNKARKITASTGIISTVAGNGLAGITRTSGKIGQFLQSSVTGVQWGNVNPYTPSNGQLIRLSGSLTTDIAAGSFLNRMILAPIDIGVSTYFGMIYAYSSGVTTAGTFRVGIYSSDQTGQPGTLVADFGSQSVSTTGLLQFTSAVSVLLSPGRYWLAGVAQSGTFNMSAIGTTVLDKLPWHNLGSNAINQAYSFPVRTSVTGALPTTAGSNTLGTDLSMYSLGLISYGTA